MTRAFDGLVCCPHCKKWHTAETALERWIRNHADLDSRTKGIARFDCDILLHRYLMPTDKKGTRELQCVMFIEAKTQWANVSPSQRDTLSMLSQVLRNRKDNRHQTKRGRHAGDHIPPCSCYSHMLGREVRVRLFGGHLLRMSGDCPESSQSMTWDGEDIDTETLLRVLRFERDPDDISKPIDWRRRWSSFNEIKAQLILPEF